jgi:hypothetical protein
MLDEDPSCVLPYFYLKGSGRITRGWEKMRRLMPAYGASTASETAA